MTIWQFFKALRAANLRWYHRHGTVRSDDTNLFCPLEAVGFSTRALLTGDNVDYHTAAIRLGVNYRHAREIAYAADNLNDARPGLRRRLLRTCGLIEGTP